MRSIYLDINIAEGPVVTSLKGLALDIDFVTNTIEVIRESFLLRAGQP